MDWKLQKDIFIGFFRSGMLGYGGGPSAIPLVHKEVVERFNWMSNEEFADVLALGNALPGPIATKMAGYIGYRVGGVVGLINGIVATVLPTVIIMIGLIGLLSQFRESRIVSGMTTAVAPVVGVMLLTLTYSYLKPSKQGMGWFGTIVLGVVSLVAFQFVGIHPAIVIGVLLVYGLLSGILKKTRLQRKKYTQQPKGEVK